MPVSQRQLVNYLENFKVAELKELSKYFNNRVTRQNGGGSCTKKELIWNLVGGSELFTHATNYLFSKDSAGMIALKQKHAGEIHELQHRDQQSRVSNYLLPSDGMTELKQKHAGEIRDLQNRETEARVRYPTTVHAPITGENSFREQLLRRQLTAANEGDTPGLTSGLSTSSSSSSAVAPSLSAASLRARAFRPDQMGQRGARARIQREMAEARAKRDKHRAAGLI